MLSAPLSVVQLFASLGWEVVQSYRFPETAHVNLQEIRALSRLIRQSVETSGAASCLVIGVDSQVTLGAVCKGRSSSIQVNGLLRALMGWRILGQRKCFSSGSPANSTPPIILRDV